MTKHQGSSINKPGSKYSMGPIIIGHYLKRVQNLSSPLIPYHFRIVPRPPPAAVSSLIAVACLALGRQTPPTWRARLVQSWAFHGSLSSPDASCRTQASVGVAAMMCGIASSSSRGSMPARQLMSLSPLSINGQIAMALERAEDTVASAVGRMLLPSGHRRCRGGGVERGGGRRGRGK